MSRRPVFVALLALVGSLAGCARPAGPPAGSEALLLVTIDTLRADRLGCGGDARARTPFLDRLARRGTQLVRTVAPTPLTLPSHATILSGSLPPEHGARDNGAFRVPDDVPLVSEAFRAAGWSTAAFVAAVPVAARFGLDRGFDVYDDSPAPDETQHREGDPSFVERSADRVNGAAFDWLDAREDDAPVFLWVHYFDPHTPYRPPAPLSRLESGDAYRGEITFTDRALGRLVRRLDARFGERRTCVTADHGESLGEHGEWTHGVFVYEATTRVPWIVAGPGAPAGRIVDRVASLTEVAPALLAWRGLAETEVAFPDCLERESGEPRYVESMYPQLRHGWAALRGLRTADWKVIRAPEPEIYDLRADPGETRNLWDDEAARGRVGALVEALEDARWEGRSAAAAAPDAETLDALRALGYVGTPRTSAAGDGDEPRADPKNRIRIEGFLSRAGSALEAGNLRAARNALSLARSIDGRNKEAHLLLAQVEAKAGNVDRAFEIFDRCLGLPPTGGNSWVQYERGRVALDAGRLDVAEDAFARAIEGEPLNVDAHYNWGVVAYRAGRFGDAEARWRRVLELAPDHAPARRWLPDATARRAERGS